MVKGRSWREDTSAGVGNQVGAGSDRFEERVYVRVEEKNRDDIVMMLDGIVLRLNACLHAHVHVRCS